MSLQFVKASTSDALTLNGISKRAFDSDADLELPYEGAKEMLLVDDVDNKEFMKELFEAMYDELPAPKKKK